jgi:hypothetical protein
MAKPRNSRKPTRAPLCPYCGREAEFLRSSERIYCGRDYGPVYACFACGAWVGCHRGTDHPLGRLADKPLRAAKRRAHDAFDPTWLTAQAELSKVDPTFTLGRARRRAYGHLAALLGIPPKECHIGMFDISTCDRVVAVCESGELAARLGKLTTSGGHAVGVSGRL